MGIEVRNVTAGYFSDVPILRGVSLRAENGLVTVIIGPNGAGKSTLLQTIYGHLRPTAGEILHDGLSIVGREPKDMLKIGIGYLRQGRSVFSAMTVRENLVLGAWMRRYDRGSIEKLLEETYNRYPTLREFRKRPAGVLSGGQQRMLELARLTMTQPKTLLLDEPSVGLMPRFVDEVYEEISRLKDKERTILIVDQNVQKSIEIADYVYVLRLGENSHHDQKHDFQKRLQAIIGEWI
jgi:branched-chain amino acid transport system ATP-binding protein